MTEEHIEEVDIDALLTYAEDFIRTVEKTWYDAPSEHKIMLEKLIFPKGICYLNGNFLNREISPLFKLIEVLGESQTEVGHRSKMVTFFS